MNLIKKLLLYVLLINLFFFGIRILYDQEITIEVENQKSDFIQIFFKKDGKYSEQNSLRSELITTGEVRFNLPFGSFEDNVIRIDPLNTEGNISINKIVIDGLFYDRVFDTSSLMSNIKTIQMIDEINLNNEIKLHSIGNDPIIELYNVNIFKEQNIIQGIVSLIISFFISFLSINYFLIKLKLLLARMSSKIHSYSKKYSYISIALLAFIFSLIIIYIFYPGFMSYDTLHALRGARNGVTDSMWPPMVSYIWRFIDLFSTNPSLMHFVQVYILLHSVGYLIFMFTKRILFVLIFLMLCLIIPTIIGTLAVIWKDVLMASFFTLGFLLFYMAKDSNTSNKLLILSALGLVSVFFAICIRHNAIVAAVPFIIYLVYILLMHFNYKKYVVVFSIFLGLTLSLGMYSLKKQLDIYSLPNFIEMKSSDKTFIEIVRVLDVAGASICTNENLFFAILPNLSIAEIEKLYNPKHVNLSKDLLSKVPLDGRINNIWLNVLFEHPICFMYNKYEMTKYMTGLKFGEQFLITDPSIIENEYGYKLDESFLRSSYVHFIVRSSSIFFFKPWFIYIIGLLMIIYLILIKKLKLELGILLLSALFYLGGLIVFGNAADARLPFYTNIIFIIIVIVSFYEIKVYRKENIK